MCTLAINTNSPKSTGAPIEKVISASTSVSLSSKIVNLSSDTASSDLLKARSIFWGLGENWWKQLYDGKYQKFGPEVFDKGTHGGEIEPGFYDSAKSANELASHSDHLMKNPTVSFYKALHKIACRHFREGLSLMRLEEAGEFHAGYGKNSVSPITSLYLTSPDFDQIEKKYDLANESNILQRSYELFKDEGQRLKYFADECDKHEAWRTAFQTQTDAKIAKINDQIAKRSKDLGLSHPMATVEGDPRNVIITYNCTKEELESATTALFAEYDKNITSAKSEDEKLIIIADLFQVLEWLHPFRDGQGRTDLILLAKELVHHGFNPAILEHPYVSTFSTLEEWVSYLKTGMTKWREEKARVDAENQKKLRKPEISVPGILSCDLSDERVSYNQNTKKLTVFFDKLTREDYRNGFITVRVQTEQDSAVSASAFNKHEKWEDRRIPFSVFAPEERAEFIKIFTLSKEENKESGVVAISHPLSFDPKDLH